MAGGAAAGPSAAADDVASVAAEISVPAVAPSTSAAHAVILETMMETLMKLEGEFGEVKRDMEAMRQDRVAKAVVGAGSGGDVLDVDSPRVAGDERAVAGAGLTALSVARKWTKWAEFVLAGGTEPVCLGRVDTLIQEIRSQFELARVRPGGIVESFVSGALSGIASLLAMVVQGDVDPDAVEPVLAVFGRQLTVAQRMEGFSMESAVALGSKMKQEEEVEPEVRKAVAGLPSGLCRARWQAARDARRAHMWGARGGGRSNWGGVGLGKGVGEGVVWGGAGGGWVTSVGAMMRGVLFGVEVSPTGRAGLRRETGGGGGVGIDAVSPPQSDGPWAGDGDGSGLDERVWARHVSGAFVAGGEERGVFSGGSAAGSICERSTRSLCGAVSQTGRGIFGVCGEAEGERVLRRGVDPCSAVRRRAAAAPRHSQIEHDSELPHGGHQVLAIGAEGAGGAGVHAGVGDVVSGAAGSGGSNVGAELWTICSGGVDAKRDRTQQWIFGGNCSGPDGRIESEGGGAHADEEGRFSVLGGRACGVARGLRDQDEYEGVAVPSGARGGSSFRSGTDTITVGVTVERRRQGGSSSDSGDHRSVGEGRFPAGRAGVQADDGGAGEGPATDRGRHRGAGPGMGEAGVGSSPRIYDDFQISGGALSQPGQRKLAKAQTKSNV